MNQNERKQRRARRVGMQLYAMALDYCCSVDRTDPSKLAMAQWTALTLQQLLPQGDVDMTKLVVLENREML